MPIQVKDYTWEESESFVYITVPLKGVKPQKVDIFTTEDYIKVHYPPYFFDAWLFNRVDDTQGKAEVGNGAVVFKLEKEETRIWGQLQNPDADDKKKMIHIREAAITRHQERLQQQKSEKAEKKREIDKFAVKQQMELEEQERKRMENIKQTECHQATEDLERWKEEQRRKAQEEELALVTVYQKQAITNEKAAQEKGGRKTSKKKTNIFEAEAAGEPLRQSGVISVSFTHRDFPTAARESTAPEEEAWLKKQAEARRISDIADSELSEHERDPVWLRDKGNEFFKAGNYQNAINVFSHAIRLSNKMPALYSNRGACHMMLKNYIKSIEDTSKALELLTPPVPQNAKSRLRAHLRRGTAFCELELYAEGLQDYEAALKIEPDNSVIQADAERIRSVIQGNSQIS